MGTEPGRSDDAGPHDPQGGGDRSFGQPAGPARGAREDVARWEKSRRAIARGDRSESFVLKSQPLPEPRSSCRPTPCRRHAGPRRGSRRSRRPTSSTRMPTTSSPSSSKAMPSSAGPPAPLRVVSLAIEQFPATRYRPGHGGPLRHPPVRLARGGADAGRPGRSAVDGVLLIGEHGDYPINAKGQQLYPRRRLFAEIVETFRRSGRSVPVYNDKHFSYSWTTPSGCTASRASWASR